VILGVPELTLAAVQSVEYVADLGQGAANCFFKLRKAVAPNWKVYAVD